MGAYEDFIAAVSAMPFSGKLSIDKRTNATRRYLEVESGVSKLYWDGILAAIDKNAVIAGNGDYFVYIWKHAWGEPFYVGSGKGHRWKDKNGRCDGFYPHLDQADAITYLVLRGVDAPTARLFEQYVSANLVEAGYSLVNGDNNPALLAARARERMMERCTKTESHELIPAVQAAVMKVLNDDPRCDYRITRSFVEGYGTAYFSTAHKTSQQSKREA